MAKIHLLPEHLINQIAAGEVVEGPSSVIKELVENSIDACATKIDIEISKQLLKIQIIDNGEGISPEDLPLAFKKHATSKISSIEEILKLRTNGFRGEALPSIAAVSKVTCISKRKEDKHATKFYIANNESQITSTGASNGTNIVVDDLFFNTPARLKFLKSNNKERTYIIDLIRTFALAHPEIAFTLKIEDKEILKSSGINDQQQVLREIFSEDVYKGLVPIKLERGQVQVTGFTSKAFVSRSDKRGIFTILNGRVLKCYIMKSAVEAAYRGVLASGKHPVAVINLNLPHEEVDINVHPNKTEVRYISANAIYTTVGDAVSKALADSNYQSKNSFQPSLKDYVLTQTKVGQEEFNSALISELPHYSSLSAKDQKPTSILKTAQEEAVKAIIDENFSIHRDDFSFTHKEDKLGSQTRKFIGRLGSVDIALTHSQGLKTVISTQGNKTSFEIVSTSPDNEDMALILRGDFIGESFIKEKYLSFLHELGDEILEKEILELGFSPKISSAKSRPQANPGLKMLEEVWQRDNYTCVYCAKALLHPDLIKKSLPICSDPGELNSHLASYDHHLPASKFPELNKELRNLYACCQECNIKKSNSLASKTWTPNSINTWSQYSKIQPLKIANLSFTSPV